MSEWKEVWYVWNGYGESPKSEKVILKDGSIFYGFDWHWRYSVKGNASIVAYSLGEKRRRCVECNGKDKWKENYWFARECQTCNATGWEYKK